MGGGLSRATIALRAGLWIGLLIELAERADVRTRCCGVCATLWTVLMQNFQVLHENIDTGFPMVYLCK
jgi:hypothetical protein